MNVYQKVSVVMALMLYVPLGYQIYTKKVSQNLATFILWGILDAIVAASIYVQGGNYQLPLGYIGGCCVVITCILLTDTGEWTWVETFISCLVALSIIAWALSGPWAATIFSTTGVVLAGLLQVKDAWFKPAEQPLAVYVGFLIANSLSVLGGKAWIVEERFYPTGCVILCFIIVMVTVIRRNARHVAVA